MVFDTDYLELVGVPVGATRVRRDIADSPVGLNGLVFATDDAEQLSDRLRGHGVPIEPVVSFHRPVTIDGAAQCAFFRTLRLSPDYLQGGRVYFCEHATPELVWRREWQHHRNGARGVAEFTLVVPEPAREAARYAEVTGATPRPGASDEIELPFGTCTVRLATLDAYLARYGNAAVDARGRDAFMGALALRATALAQVRECLASLSEAIDVERSVARITIAARHAYDTVLEFVE
jgi:hypothetical protein